jgi:hypothetical protein
MTWCGVVCEILWENLTCEWRSLLPKFSWRDGRDFGVRWPVAVNSEPFVLPVTMLKTIEWVNYRTHVEFLVRISSRMPIYIHSHLYIHHPFPLKSRNGHYLLYSWISSITYLPQKHGSDDSVLFYRWSEPKFIAVSELLSPACIQLCFFPPFSVLIIAGSLIYFWWSWRQSYLTRLLDYAHSETKQHNVVGHWS